MSSRVAIGLDFDDTLMLTREAIVELLNATYGTHVRVEDCTEFSLSRRWNLDRAQFLSFFTQHEERIHRQPPMPDMKATLDSWSGKADFYVITGRPECWRQSACDWLQRHDISVRDVICADSAGEKASAVSSHGLAFFVDDRADFGQGVAEAGVPTLLLDRPYNQGMAHPLVRRVKDWKEIRLVVAQCRYLDGK